METGSDSNVLMLVALCDHVAQQQHRSAPRAHLKRKWSLELSPGTDRSPRTRPRATSVLPHVYIDPKDDGGATIQTRGGHLFVASAVRSVAMINVINNYDLFVAGRDVGRPPRTQRLLGRLMHCHRPPAHPGVAMTRNTTYKSEALLGLNVAVPIVAPRTFISGRRVMTSEICVVVVVVAR